jgi:uncharacterized lipoprotein YehR (DUF1307 family)
MKNLMMILFAAVMTISLAACGNSAKKAEEKKEPVKEEVVVAPVPAPEVAVPKELTPAESLKAFQAYAKEYAEAYNNIAKDPKKFGELSKQMQQKVADMERLKIDLTPKLLKDYEKALALITNVNSGGKK